MSVMNLQAALKAAVETIREAAANAIDNAKTAEASAVASIHEQLHACRKTIGEEMTAAALALKAETEAGDARLRELAAGGVEDLLRFTADWIGGTLTAQADEAAKRRTEMVNSFLAPPVPPPAPEFVPLPVEEIVARLEKREMAEPVEAPQLSDDEAKQFAGEMRTLLPQVDEMIKAGPAETVVVSIAANEPADEQAETQAKPKTKRRGKR